MAAGTSCTKTVWTLPDILDLEYRFMADASVDDQELILRDRALFLDRIQPQVGPGPDPGESGTVYRRKVVRLWMEHLRPARDPEAWFSPTSPGAIYARVSRILGGILFIAGWLLGTGVSATFFTYSGDRPVNVSWFLGVTVFSQILLLLFPGIWLMLRALAGSPRHSLNPLAGAVTALVVRQCRRMTRLVHPEHRNTVSSVFARVLSRGGVYGSVFQWPAFTAMQVSGLGFNTGLLLSMLLRIVFSDTAFGWQSTVQVSSDLVFHVVSVMALPWSWFVPADLAFPSLEQIQGSRLVLKEGLGLMTTPDLVSWWPFLCLSVVFYGFLPRLVLYAGSRILGRRALDVFPFAHGDVQKLMRRLTLPRVTTLDRNPDPEPTTPLQPAPGPRARDRDVGTALLLVPDEIADDLSPEELNRACGEVLGLRVARTVRIFGEDRDEFQAITQALNPGKTEQKNDWALGGIVVVQEAWQPPITQTVRFFERLRSVAGATLPIRVLLIGKPAGNRILTRPATLDVSIWNTRLCGMADAYLELVPLEGS